MSELANMGAAAPESAFAAKALGAGGLVLKRVIGPALIAVFVIGTWQAGVWNNLFGLGPFALPLPGDIAHAFHARSHELFRNLGDTIRPALLGYALGNLCGILAGALLVVVPTTFSRKLSAFLAAFQSVPVVALAPIAALWIYSDLWFKAVVVIVLCFPSMTVYASRGMTHMDEDVELLMNSYEARPDQVFLKVRLPNALPFAFTALRYSVILALIGTVICEILHSRSGLGYEIDDALGAFDTAEAWAAALMLGALGITWYTAVGILERVLAPWTFAQRNR